MFVMGSHNLSRAAWDDNKNNIELSLLFFDVPGLYTNVLPFELIPQNIDDKNNPCIYSNKFSEGEYNP